MIHISWIISHFVTNFPTTLTYFHLSKLLASIMGGCFGRKTVTEVPNNNETIRQVDVIESLIEARTVVGSSNGTQIFIVQPHNLTKRTDCLVKDMLDVIWTLVEESNLPVSMFALHRIAEQEDGWLEVINSMIEVIPRNHPLGPAVMLLILDDCPLHTAETLEKLANNLDLSKCSDVHRRCNINLVIGCLAEKVAGPFSIALLLPVVLNFLLEGLESSDPYAVLTSIISLEKFSLTSENKSTIYKKLKPKNDLLLKLETTVSHEQHCEDNDKLDCENAKTVWHEVSFCAQWTLDNMFVFEGRNFAYKQADNSQLNAMLNANDTSEYLKIATDGLEARSDAASFESVRCTFQIDRGVWYYEVTILTPGVMQIGWATKDSKFLNYDGYGIGDDESSLAFDGCRCLIWYNARSTRLQIPRWKANDVLGCLIDLDSQKAEFTINDISIEPNSRLFECARGGFFAAASFMSFQQCRFNFGSEPFKHPPSIPFETFDKCGRLTDSERKILPRCEKLAMLNSVVVLENSCQLCFDETANTCLLPCQHRDLCQKCAVQLEICPICREEIHEFKITTS